MLGMKKDRIIFKANNFMVCDLNNGTYKPYLKITLLNGLVIRTKNISRGELDNLKELKNSQNTKNITCTSNPSLKASKLLIKE